jgi:preprotein translocase subunit YajC
MGGVGQEFRQTPHRFGRMNSMNFTTFLATASNASGTASTGTAATGAATGSSTIMQLLIFIVPLGLMYLLLIMPQRKKEKKAKALINSSIVGDTVVTIGGVCGKIVNIKDDEITIETSIDRTKVSYKKWAIKEVIKPVTDAT